MTSGPINVLYCENNVDGTVGGSYYSLLYLVKGLDHARFRPIVIFYTQHSLLPAFRAAGIETHVWARPRPFTFGRRVPAALAWLRGTVRALQRALNFVHGFLLPSLIRVGFLLRRNVSIVHLNNSVLYNHDWMLAARLMRRKCITHERGINERYPPAARYFGRRLDAVICISEAVRDNMRRRSADFGNLITIHNGLDPDALAARTSPQALRGALGIGPAAPVIVMIGNIRAWKGQHTLVRALDRVRRVCPDVRCVFVGATSPVDREYEAGLRRLVASLGLQEHVVFAAFQPHVADYLRMSDIVVHASVLPEPFGRVILEAMACRKPIVGARAGGVPEIIAEGETGFTFPPGDADSLADAIIHLASDRERARRLGNNGYDRLVRHFHIAKNLEATERLYSRLMGMPPLRLRHETPAANAVESGVPAARRVH